MINNDTEKSEKAQQTDEMWNAYESEKIRLEQKLSKQLKDEVLTIQDSETTDEEKQPTDIKSEKFSDDIRSIIDDEIEQKLEWAHANKCRAYIGATF